ncbi:MAG TPA: VWA domain-containing protein, partial [Thermoanaerobaculia bacterium]|nr:VWA domain-containing protein [Thermoanaerobaculia bacterium]
RAGKAVRGLRKEDFVVLEDGKPQAVTNFAEYADVILSRGDGEGSPGKIGGDPSPSAGLRMTPDAPARAARRFVFFVDEMALHPVTRRKLAGSAKELLQGSMQPGDEAMILTPAAATKIALPFTSDRAAVGKTLEKIIAATDSRAYTQDAAELRYLETAVARAGTPEEMRLVIQSYADSVRRRVEQRLGHLRGIVAGMSGMPGKKVLVLVATSLPATPGKDVVDQLWRREWGLPQMGRDFYDLSPRISEVARTAAANGVTIYSLQPAYAMADVIGGPDIGRARGGGGPPRDIQSEITQNELTFNTFSDATGGKYFRGDASVPTTFRQIADDLTAYYSLGYRATESDTDKPHRVEVRVKDRPELRVRARRDVVRKSPAQEMEDLTVAALLRTSNVNELGIAAELGPLARQDRRVIIPVIVRIPLQNLTFLQTDTGHRATFRVHFAALGQRADFAAGEDREQAIDVPAGELEKARGRYFTYETKLRVSPGKYRIAVGVFDPVSRLAGFGTMDVDAK